MHSPLLRGVLLYNRSMQIILTIYLFITGTVIASFLNALMYRLDKEYKYPEIFTKSSHCEKCNKKLKWYDLLPVLSYIFTRGKCSKCGSTITIYYPISELILGISFGLFFFMLAPWYAYVILLVLFCLSYFDFNYQAIPQTPTLLFTLLGVIFIFIQSVLSNVVILNALPSGLILLLILSLLLFVMYGIKNFNLKEGFQGLGLGDFIVFISLSMFLATKQFWVMFAVTILTALIYLIPGLISGKKDMKSSLPLLPFITLGYIVVVIYGENIFDYIKDFIWIL